MDIQKNNPVQENIKDTSTEQKASSSFVQEPKVKKKSFVLIVVLAILFLIILSFITHYFLTKQDTNMADNGSSQQVTWEECERKIEELRTYIESENYCNNANECQVIDMPQCNFGLAGIDVDMDYIGEVFSEFYSPDGNCWTRLAPECTNPAEGKTIACEGNKCLFKSMPDDYNGQQLTGECEEFTFWDCPKECYGYDGPSHCGFDVDGFEICTDNLMNDCFSEPYDPFKN